MNASNDNFSAVCPVWLVAAVHGAAAANRAREEARQAAVDARQAPGAKWLRGRDVAEIARLVRAEVAAAVKGGTLPRGLKASVRISRYSMGRSLDVALVASAGFVVANPARTAQDAAYPHGAPNGVAVEPRLSPEAAAVVRAVEAIVAAYDYDRSDLASDYHCREFSASVSIS